uniref:Trichohyalin-plectin-homology domain-containing protein n=1 Tax=Spumella elongata TaxID=89044 RepID=A0A7S3GV59_9STRA
MNKQDLILAKKALAARQVKTEHQFIKTIMKERTLKQSHSTSKLQSAESTLNKSEDFGNSRPFSATGTGRSFAGKSTTQLPDINAHTSMSSPHKSKRAESLNFHEPSTKELSEANSQMVKELAQRATTAKTARRKMQSSVSKTINLRMTNTLNNTAQPEHDFTETGAEIPNIEITDNFFMPKKQIQRSDGATLSDIYASKKADSWGKILKAQIAEEERMKIVNRRKKEEADKRFGDLLRKQVNDHTQRMNDTASDDVNFAALEDARSKRQEDMQKGRVEDAIRRHKQFIANAVEDMGIKRKQKEKDMLDDIFASTVMINKAKELIAAEERKKQEDKEYHKHYQEVLFKENQENLARKAEERARAFAEEKRIIAENDRQFQREQARREQDLAQKLVRTSEGPAHHIVQQIIDEKRKKEKEFFDNLFRGNNMLNTQLKRSEDAAAARNASNGQSLTDEWVKNTTYKENKKREDDERNAQILGTMRKMLSDQEKEDQHKRQMKMEAGKRYQQELDAQLKELRDRSFASLAKTMSEQEMLYNSDLLKKTAVNL